MQKQTVDYVFYLQFVIILSLLLIISFTLNLIYENNLYKLPPDSYTPTFYYINLDKSIQRKQRYEKRIQKYKNLQTERIPAITPNDIKQYKIIASSNCKFNSELEIACLLSHLKAIFIAYKNIMFDITKKINSPTYALITEDDVVVLEMPEWEKLIKSAPLDWEILQLVASGPIADYMYNNSPPGWQKYIHNTYCAAAYLINLQGMTSILESCVPEYKSIDNWNDITTIYLNHNADCVADHIVFILANTYTYTVPLFNFEGIDSTIHPHHLPMHHLTMNIISDKFNNYQQQELLKKKHI